MEPPSGSGQPEPPPTLFRSLATASILKPDFPCLRDVRSIRVRRYGIDISGSLIQGLPQNALIEFPDGFLHRTHQVNSLFGIVGMGHFSIEVQLGWVFAPSVTTDSGLR